MTDLTVLDPDDVVVDTTDYAALSTHDAKKLLCTRLNEHVIKVNSEVFQRHREERAAFMRGEGPYTGEPFYLKDYSLRRIDQAVFTARQRGGFSDLLEAAGYRPRKKR